MKFLVSENIFFFFLFPIHVQSTLVISKSKGPSKTLRDIRTSIHQICSIEEKIFENQNFTNGYVI